MQKEPKTPSEKARRATLAIIARLGACAYLAYIIYKLIKMSVDGDSGMPQGVVIATTVVMGLAALALIAITVKEFFTGVKNHDYSMHKYYQDELQEKGLTQNEFGEFVPADNASNEDSGEQEEGGEEETETAEADEEDADGSAPSDK